VGLLRPAFVAFAVTVVLEPLIVIGLRRAGVLDYPNARSSHERPTPRGGGLAPATGVLVALATSSQVTGSARFALVVATAMFGLLGLADDVFSNIPPLVRLGLQGAGALVVVPWILDDPAAPVVWIVVLAAGVTFWLVGYVNAFNFMDGIDGISTAQALAAGVAWCCIGSVQESPVLATGGAVLAGAALGFCPFNFPRARVFLGDVGSYAFGAFIATLAVLGLREGLRPEAVLAPLALYATDTTTTLLRRFKKQEVVYLAHREHVYQRLVTSGMSHWTVTLVVLFFIAACSSLGALSLFVAWPIRLGADLGIVLLLACYVATPALAERSASSA
jgi:UDP-N-acetylmuramyl pentapeptide phosphotransferase/UDP-N-acetylglucosamine-1-phosphate transferase